MGFIGPEIVATITVVRGSTDEIIDWFKKPEVFYFTQFAVKQSVQGTRLGARLLEFVESFTRNEGAAELALDTSEEASDLVAWYRRKGYRQVALCQLPDTTYRSVVMSKTLAAE